MKIDFIGSEIGYEKATLINDYYKGFDIILIQKHYKDVFFDFESNYSVWYGSRFSAKTWVKCLQLLFKAKNQKYFRCLYTRATQTDARHTQFQQFIDMITRIYPFLQNDFIIEKTSMKIICKANGNFLKGASFQDPPRSLAEYTDFWVDEPITHKSSITRNDLLDISGTLRNSYGIKTQKHLTFNPISIKEWIYNDFFLEKNLFKANILLANYQHNVFCPLDKIEELEQYKVLDYQRYLVDALGEWGVPKLENLWVTTYDATKHLSPVPIERNNKLQTVISIDFNVSPMTCIVCQYDPYFRIINIIEEYRELNSNVYELAKWIKNNYNTMLITITGDSSGNNRHAYSVNSLSGFQIIAKELNLNMRTQIKVPAKKAGYVKDKRLITNVFFSRKNIQIDKTCKYLIEDIETVTVNAEGQMNKTKDTTKTHLLDCLCDLFYMLTDGKIKNI